MQLSTSECLLTDLLDCGYADLSMLDGLYNTIGDEIYYGDRADLLKRAVGNGEGLNGILYEFYTDVTLAVKAKIEDLLEEYENAEDKEDTELVRELDLIFYKEDKFIPLKKKEMGMLKEKTDDLNNVNPFCNCLDSYFQNDLDQTFDDDESVLTNAIDLIKYWLDR